MFMNKTNHIVCNVISCTYNESKACNANEVEITLDNALVANRVSETACKTFQPRVY